MSWSSRFSWLLLPLLLSGEPAPVAAPGAGARVVGEWIWTRADARGFDELSRGTPSLVPAVHVATVQRDLVAHRALSPALVGERPVALVVRFDDSFHGAWDDGTALDVAPKLQTELRRVVDEARATGVTPTELQLDYDAPVRRLSEWSEVVQRVAPALDVPVWVTSIPAHLSDPRYGERLRGAVAGHILQLFDTGWPCSATNVARLASRLGRAGLPYRIGVGAFERRRQGRVTTDHGCWARAADRFDGASRGRFVFPASVAPAAVARLLKEDDS